MAIYDYVDSKVATGAEAFGEGTPAIMGAGPIGFFCINRHIDLSVAGDLFIASDGKFESGDTIDIFNVSECILNQINKVMYFITFHPQHHQAKRILCHIQYRVRFSVYRFQGF